MPKPWIVKPLTFPYADEAYTVEPVSYEAGLTLIAVTNGESEDIPKDAPDKVLYRLCMGATWDQMLEDGCPFPVMVRAGLASIQYQSALVMGIDTEAAVAIGESVWESGIDPETLAAIIKAATPQTDPEPATSKTSTSTASARRTRTRASTPTTTSPTVTPPTASKATTGRSRGKGSPNTSQQS